MYMVIMYLLFRISVSQELNLALQDLQDDPLTANDWKVLIKGKAQSYSEIIESCDQNFMLLTTSPNIYQKTFTIPHFDYNEITIEMEVFFIAFSQSFIRINIDQKIIFQQTFRSELLQQNIICPSIDYQYTIQQKFYSSQTQLNLRIFYHASALNSQIGIRNLNIYTNGYKLSNGCSMNTPYLQGATCVQFCTNANPYLGGTDMLVCQSDLIGQSNLIGQYATTQTNLWKFYTASPTINQQQYLTAGNYLINNNLYNNIMYSNLFSSALTCQSYCYYISQSINNPSILHIWRLGCIIYQLLFKEGSQIGIYISGDTIYSNNMVKINQVRGKYYSSTGSEIYFTNITSTTGVSNKVRRTLITFQGKFYSNSVQIGFSQQIYGTGSYGFGNIYVYQSYNDPNIAQRGLYGIPYGCNTNYYAYNGYCVQECPPYSHQDYSNNNCTDLAYKESIIFHPDWWVYRSNNLQGTYIIKDFYNNNFDQYKINQIFSLIPISYNNYQNGQPFSFIGNIKILGGYNSWGYGSYGIEGTLPIHNQIRIYFKLYLIDNWSPTDKFIYYLDTAAVDTYIYNNPISNLQGLSNLDQEIYIEKLISHTSQTFKLIFHCSIEAKNSSSASCGIQDLFVLYYQYVDVICNSPAQYYSYFTNNCEQCLVPDCYLYPDNFLIFNPKSLMGCMSLDQGILNYCQNCLEPVYVDLNYDGFCECGQLFVPSGGQCTRCHYSCTECNGVSENQCLQCDTSTRQLVGNTCQCLSGYYDEYAKDVCQLISSSSTYCYYTCKTCHSQRYNHCVTCPDNSFRTINQYNTCLCNEQYMDVGQDLCQFINCDLTCLTCNGLLESSCLTCSTNFRYDNGYCICDGLFNNLQSTNVCENNYSNCDNISCGDQQIFRYMNCDSTLYRYLNIVSSSQQQCDCFDGYFDQLGMCSQCDVSCLTCQNTATTCLTCDISQQRLLDLNQCACTQGYNDKLAPGQICVLNYIGCHYSCVDCFGPNYNQCLTCKALRGLNNSTCPCVSSRYDNSNTESCDPCNQTCLTCSGNQTNDCLSCDPSIFRVLSQNSCICQIGYFENQGVCSSCHYSCRTCNTSGSQSCNDCDTSNFRLINDSKECNCINGYADVGNRQCQVCPNECIDCNSSLKCLNCKYEKQILNVNGRCDCIQGYQKDNDGQCVDCQSDQGKALFSCQYQNAQDGVWTYGEQCDDGNNDPRDGCDNFQITPNYSCNNIFNYPSICYKCPQNCLSCQLQQDQAICISCNQNYYNAQSECIKCYEESCLECIKPSYCSVCKSQKIPIKGQCNSCEYGYYYDGSQCSSECGDGIKTIDEQCDDGNVQSCDGCSDNCQIEYNFVCQYTNKQQNCFMSEQPYLILSLPYQQSSKEKQLTITVSQDVTYQDVQIQILNKSIQAQLQYQVSGSNTLNIDIDLTFQQAYEQITLDLIINGIILNKYKQTLKSNKLQIIFNDVFILSNQQQQSSDQMLKLGQGVVITLTCLSVTSLLMGGASQLIIFLNLIQQLQYIQYINIEFPENLIYFLNLFNGFTISPLFDLFNINFPYLRPSQLIFAYNGINAYFIANMKGFIFGLIVIFIIYIILIFIINLMQDYKYFQLKRQQFSYHQLRKFNKIINFIIKISTKIKQQSLNSLIIAQCYDNQFAIFLQITNPSMDNIDRNLNIILAFIAQFISFKLIFQEIPNEEIKDGKWQNLYNQLKLLQSFVFIFAIVQLQDFPQSQVLIISISSLTVSFYILIIQPFENVFNNYRLIIQESILFITIITFIAYIYFPSQINPITLGWFHITNLIIMMTGSLVIDIYYYVIIIKKMY